MQCRASGRIGAASRRRRTKLATSRHTRCTTAASLRCSTQFTKSARAWSRSCARCGSSSAPMRSHLADGHRGDHGLRGRAAPARALLAGLPALLISAAPSEAAFGTWMTMCWERSFHDWREVRRSGALGMALTTPWISFGDCDGDDDASDSDGDGGGGAGGGGGEGRWRRRRCGQGRRYGGR